MTDSLKPGQNIKCTIVKHIKLNDDVNTVRRLMRFDPEVKRRLKSAQEYRQREQRWKTWGGRPRPIRMKAARYANPTINSSWNMRFFPHIANDFKAVEQYLKIEAV